MQFGLSEEQEMIVSTVRSFVENEIYPHEDEVEKLGYVPKEIGDEIKRKTIELGFYASNFPEEVGGGGLNHLEFALLERELGRGSMALTISLAGRRISSWPVKVTSAKNTCCLPSGGSGWMRWR